MRSADARTATRRGWSITRLGCARDSSPARRIAGGTRVVLPAPGGATSTSDRRRRSASTISGSELSIGSGDGTCELFDRRVIRRVQEQPLDLLDQRPVLLRLGLGLDP